MPLPTLTFIKSAENAIPCALATVSYSEFLGAIETLINASTHWNCAKTLDGVNQRGYIEMWRKDSGAGRLLFTHNSGVVGATAGSEKPIQAFRQAPWANATATLAPRQWIGFSPTATSAANDPFGTSTQPYTTWTKLIPCNPPLPGPGQTMFIVESAETLAVFWSTTTNQIGGFVYGDLLESTDGNTSTKAVVVTNTTPDTTAAGTAMHTSYHAGISDVVFPFNSSVNTAAPNATNTARCVGLACDNSGNLTNLRRANFEFMSLNNYAAGGMQSGTVAALTPIILSGGAWNAAATNNLLGKARQMHWGPSARRGEKLRVAGVEKAIYVTYDASTAQMAGLWFSQTR